MATYYASGDKLGCQCSSGRLRSVIDGYLCCKYYFSDLSFYQYILILQAIKAFESRYCGNSKSSEQGYGGGFSLMLGYCPTIKRYRHYVRIEKESINKVLNEAKLNLIINKQ